MVALIFLPIDACDDAKPNLEGRKRESVSRRHSEPPCVSFRYRANRQDHKNDLDLFERVLIGLY